MIRAYYKPFEHNAGDLEFCALTIQAESSERADQLLQVVTKDHLLWERFDEEYF
jgi:hypothetical protein